MVLDLDESSPEPGGLIAKKKIGWCAEAFSLACVASARRGRGIGDIRRALKPARAARGRGGRGGEGVGGRGGGGDLRFPTPFPILAPATQATFSLAKKKQQQQ